MSKCILDSQEIDRALTRIAHEIVERYGATELPAIVGIRTCGEFLAERLTSKIKSISGQDPLYGVLDINLYRDDLTRVSEQPVIRETVIDFNCDDKTIVLVDDVLYTGRTVRCAMDALMDYGRPKIIQLAVLIDRGHRELPIRADYVGKNIPTSLNELVDVALKEMGRGDEVLVRQEAE